MCVTLHPLSSFPYVCRKLFTPVPIPLSVEQCIDPDGYTRKESCYICPCTSKMDGEQLFEDMQLGGVVNFLAFRQAVAGYNLIKQKANPYWHWLISPNLLPKNVCLSLTWNRKRCYTHQWSLMGKTAARTMLPLSPTKSALIKVPSASILPETLIKAETDTPFYWTGWKRNQWPGPWTCHRSSWRRIRQPFRLQIRQTGTKLRLSGFTTGTDQTYYQYDKRGKRTLYLCQ